MKHFPLLLLVLTLLACGEAPSFHITGHILGAKDSTVYLERLPLTGDVDVVDSLRLTADGAFTLRGTDTITGPEFYRLRLGEQVVNLAVDSTETITVEARWPRLSYDYTVEGSGQSDTIRLITEALRRLEGRLTRVADDRTLTLADRQQEAERQVTAYKDTIKMRYIQNNYASAASYFALFQMAGPYRIFDLQANQSDVRWAMAVANAWQGAYPTALRTQNLANIVLAGRQATRRHTIELNPDGKKVRETGIIDMGFPDLAGRERRLTDLTGQVVLLEFTAYGAKDVPAHNLALRELYTRYHAAGLEIYQVSIDPDEHLWKTVAENLPWICVYNREGEASDMLTIYQVASLPTYFLIDRQGDLSARMENIPDLEKAVKGLL